jgi:hypothetical protein
MHREIESTMKKRHDFLVAKTNEIWHLEKEKGYFRNKLQEIRKEIKLGKRQAGRINFMDYGNAAGGIGKNEKIAESVKKEIDEIKAKQLKLVEEIKNFIDA